MVIARLRARARRAWSKATARLSSASVWEPAAYWLLYVVAVTAVLLHWRMGNHLLAVGCAVAVLVSVRLIIGLRSPA
ncbi:hypothetical protein [Salinactinospora qingdaonensis]|uniref:Uncharacterized protein n=1 Tax=Salinactinospora qingdaonensis TaxID=702744 RepID=A0ABP7F5Z6_9ACTN